MDVPTPLATTGVPGLDEVLAGGLPRDHVYLIQGDPGAGKTTLSLQFLLEGAAKGERGLYVTLSESRKELMAVARSHGWTLDSISVFEMLIGEEMLTDEEDLTLFHPSEIELGETITTILREIERIRPSRLVLDSLSEIRLLSQSTLRYRKQVLALKEFFATRNITALFLDDRTADQNDIQLHSVPHGVIILERMAPNYGSPRRRLEVVKIRGVNYRGGFHDFVIKTGGIRVFPRPTALSHRLTFSRDQILSGIPELDQLTGGGLRVGNSTLILGPAGVGKSSLAARYAASACERGEKVGFFVFDEAVSTLIARSEGLGMPLAGHHEAGLLTLQQIDPAELAPGEFTQHVRESVDRGARLVIIDSLNGYLNSMPEERYLTLHLHELLGFLNERDVVTIIVMAQHGLIGPGMSASVDISYLADCVLLLRYYESDAEIHKAVSVLKKRSGPHERSIRDFDLRPGEIVVGPPLRGFRGLLTGVPIVENIPGEVAPEG